MQTLRLQEATRQTPSQFKMLPAHSGQQVHGQGQGQGGPEKGHMDTHTSRQASTEEVSPTRSLKEGEGVCWGSRNRKRGHTVHLAPPWLPTVQCGWKPGAEHTAQT